MQYIILILLIIFIIYIYITKIFMQILWIPLLKTKYNDFFQEITRLDKKSIIFTPNPEIILKTQEDTDFKDIILKANYLIPDWIGLFIAYQIIKTKNTFKWLIWIILSIILLPIFVINVIFRKNYIYWIYWDKICWSDLTLDLLNFAEKNNVKITILDLYNPGDAKKVASQNIFNDKLKEKYPRLDFDYIIFDENKKDDIINSIKNNKSKILFSTLGMKKQEQSVIDLMWLCEDLMIWAWIWSSFDYITWFQNRAPIIWRRLWIEWFYRLITGPQKIKRIKRLYNAIVVFIYKIIIIK